LFLLAAVIGNTSAETLTLRIENAEAGKGAIMAGIFNDENTFPDSYFRGEKTAVSGGVVVIAFADLPRGQYAVSVYQDSNNNGQLDKNIFGIPKEKYGFSNNAGRPDYRKCVFGFDTDMTVTISLK
jgi:uncharacterized protein (DUF2141 family)